MALAVRLPKLAPLSRPAIRTALLLYGEILDQVEPAGYAVLDGRVRVPRRRRIAVAARNLVEARAAARAERRVTVTTRAEQPPERLGIPGTG